MVTDCIEALLLSGCCVNGGTYVLSAPLPEPLSDLLHFLRLVAIVSELI